MEVEVTWLYNPLPELPDFVKQQFVIKVRNKENCQMGFVWKTKAHEGFCARKSHMLQFSFVIVALMSIDY